MIALAGFLVFVGLIIYEIEQNASATGPGLAGTVSQVENFVSGNLTAAQIGSYAAAAGFTGADLKTAIAIALAESFPSGNPNSLNSADPGGSFGLWQIDLGFHPEYQGVNLYDPQTNANAAYAIYAAAGNSFTPWSTYTNGAYTAYLNAAEGGING